MTVSKHLPRHHKDGPAAPHHSPAHTISYMQGIDVSHHQGTVDWAKVKAAGMSFAFVKATEGRTVSDSKFSTNWAAMKNAGLLRGAYHFGHPRSHAVDQAKRFVDTVQPTHGDLQLVLDLEHDDKQSAAHVWNWTQEFLAEIKKQTGRPGIIYTGNYFWRDHVDKKATNLDCPLWLADYRHHPVVPHSWKHWTFWQYTEKGAVAGIHGHVDRNNFRGNLAQLQSLTLP